MNYLGLSLFFIVCGCARSPSAQAPESVLATHLRKSGADAPGIIRIIGRTQIETTKDERRRADQLLEEERMVLEDKLAELTAGLNITWKPDTPMDVVEEHYASATRQRLVADIATLKFQIALETFLQEQSRQRLE